MSKMRIEFDTDGDSFKEKGFCTEVYSIFGDIHCLLALGYENADIKDDNGNIIGHWSIEE